MESIVKSLAFDWRYCLLQMALFIILVIVMNQVFWKPMLAHLAKRDQGIKEAHDSVEAMRHEMEALRAEYQARIVRIESEARTHIQQAIKDAQSERERILGEARAHAEAALQQGVQAMERERSEAFVSLRDRTVAIALGAVDKALGRAVDGPALKRAVESGVASRI
ncbi:MAG TPA: ATP synthase F0 subunit B [Chthonomonadaceae bacterium]|nr:ATP synthase F0 subunit B [Chthonomonadaceae bacterium]